jgi:SAM-dependent methyltransferase
MAGAYSREFFENREDSLRSARAVVPIVLDWIKPKRVIDVGCGVGSWLKAFAENGVTQFTGIDGDYVDRNLLVIPRDRFVAADLTKPLNIDGSFDLVVSLEVAEHLPESAAITFVDSLTSLGPVVLFSAAIPLQGGANHLNEQWPDYWVRLFAVRGFRPADCLRRRIWKNDEVNYFYAQNALFFVREDSFAAFPKLAEECRNTNLDQLSLVHPKQFLPAAGLVKKVSGWMPGPVRCVLKKILGY